MIRIISMASVLGAALLAGVFGLAKQDPEEKQPVEAEAPKNDKYSPPGHTVYIRFKVTRVLDGNTLAGTVSFPWHIQLSDKIVKVYGYQALVCAPMADGEIVSEQEMREAWKCRNKLIEMFDGKTVFLSPANGESNSSGHLIAYVHYLEGDKLVSLRDFMKQNSWIRGSTIAVVPKEDVKDVPPKDDKKMSEEERVKEERKKRLKEIQDEEEKKKKDK